MSDFNPNSRSREEFFYPLPSKNWFTRAENYLVSVFAMPGWIRGIDISHWNGTVDFQKVKDSGIDFVDFQKVKDSGIDFIIIKATEGIGFLDPKWDYNWRATIDHEMIPMPYHFFRSNFKGGEQVDWFFENADVFVDEVEGNTLLWWDVETADGVDITTRQNRLHGACVHTVWESLMGNPAWVNDYFQWPAHWSPVSYPTLPIGWTKEKTKVWQNGIYPTYSWVEPVEGAGTVDHGAGTVDHNYFFGTVQELRDLLGITPPLPPDCCDKIAEIEQELEVIKSRLSQGELVDADHEDRLKSVEWGRAYANRRIEKIEAYINNITSVPWE
jgi:hypothetical protein